MNASNSASWRRFHPLYAFRFFRYGLLVCLIPLARAALSFEFGAFFDALYQDALLLCVFGTASAVLWMSTGFCVRDGALCTRSAIVYKTHHVFRLQSVCAVELKRPLHCRFLGASKVTLYFENTPVPPRLSFYLSRRDAAVLAERILPVESDVAVYAPAGIERLNFMMLSANAVTSAVFFTMAANRIDDFFAQDLQALAAQNLSRLASFLSHWLPAGLAGLFALAFFIAALTMLYSFVRTFGFTACRSRGVLLSRGGLFTLTERRVRAGAVTFCEVRVTPAARLLRRYPLYLRAGSFHGADIPFMVFSARTPDAPQLLLPRFFAVDRKDFSSQGKSAPQYFWLSGTALALTLGMSLVAMVSAPALLPFPAVGALLSLGALAVAVEGFFREGVKANENGTLALCRTARMTRHEYCIFTPDVSYRIFQTPFAAAGGRCNCTVQMPGGRGVRVRGIRAFAAERLSFPR